MSGWFRFYSEALHDRKLQAIARTTGLSMPTILGYWTALLSMANESPVRGILLFSEDMPITVADIAFELRVPEEEAETVINAMTTMGLLRREGDWIAIANWDKRQFENDSSTERVRRYRQKRKMLGLPVAPTYDPNEIILRDGCRCVYCGSTDNLVVDHVVPIDLGGTDDPRNLVAACRRCNSGKAGRTPEMAGYSFFNQDAERRYRDYLSEIGRVSSEHVTVTSDAVTVTETPPDYRLQTQTTDTEDQRANARRADALAPPPAPGPPGGEHRAETARKPPERAQSPPSRAPCGAETRAEAPKARAKRGESAPNGRSTRARPELSAIISEFVNRSGIPPPANRRELRSWYSAAQEMLTEFGDSDAPKDPTPVLALMRRFFEAREQGEEWAQFTISSPRSLIKTMRALRAGQVRTRASPGGRKPSVYEQNMAALRQVLAEEE